MEIELFLEITAQVLPQTAPGVTYLGTVMRGPSTEASERAYVVEQILDRTIPSWRSEKPAADKDFRWLRKQASRAKVALEREEELTKTSEIIPLKWILQTFILGYGVVFNPCGKADTTTKQ